MVDSIDDPSDRDYITADGGVVSSEQHNNPEKKTEVKQLKRRLKIVREVIAYKNEDRQFIDHHMIDLAFFDTLPLEFNYYKHQDRETLFEHEERIIRDLATLGVDVSRSSERKREELETENMNEKVSLDDDEEEEDDIDDEKHQDIKEFLDTFDMSDVDDDDEEESE